VCQQAKRRCYRRVSEWIVESATRSVCTRRNQSVEEVWERQRVVRSARVARQEDASDSKTVQEVSSCDSKQASVASVLHCRRRVLRRVERQEGRVAIEEVLSVHLHELCPAEKTMF